MVALLLLRMERSIGKEPATSAGSAAGTQPLALDERRCEVSRYMLVSGRILRLSTLSSPTPASLRALFPFSNELLRHNNLDKQHKLRLGLNSKNLRETKWVLCYGYREKEDCHLS